MKHKMGTIDDWRVGEIPPMPTIQKPKPLESIMHFLALYDEEIEWHELNSTNSGITLKIALKSKEKES